LERYKECTDDGAPVEGMNNVQSFHDIGLGVNVGELLG
jgi:hypothetical protein